MLQSGVGKHLLMDFVRSLGTADCHMALVTDSANLSPATETFEGQGEVRAQGYAAGGKRLNNFACGLDDGIAWASWSNVEWQNATIKASGAVIYDRATKRVITVLDFGGEQSSSQGMFRVRMPPPGAANAVIWLS